MANMRHVRSVNGLQYFLTDHLGSTVAVTNASGTLTSQQRYLPFGGVRSNPTIGSITQTDLTYTGQRALDPGMGGLMDYHARFYDPYDFLRMIKNVVHEPMARSAGTPAPAEFGKFS